MRAPKTAAFVFSLLPLHAAAATDPEYASHCADLEACFAELRDYATMPDDDDIRPLLRRDATAGRIAGYGDAAVPTLLEWLGDEDYDVANAAAIALGDIGHLDA